MKKYVTVLAAFLITAAVLVSLASCPTGDEDKKSKNDDPYTSAGQDPYFSNKFDASLCSFYDKFDGNKLDLTKWGYQNGNGLAPYNYGQRGWGNNEKQSYQTENVKVADGKLTITAKRVEQAIDAMVFTSGKIVTANSLSEPGDKFSQTYGRFEAKMRMTKAEPGMWPAFWMMPVSSFYGGWPRSGEIDIMELKGSIPDQTNSTLHAYDPNRYHAQNNSSGDHYRGYKCTFADDLDFTEWHVYGVHWTPNEMTFLVDGMKFPGIPASWTSSWYTTEGHGSAAPFDKNFHLIINLAVGGHYDGNKMPGNGKLPISLEVDWVRVYTLENNPWQIMGTLSRSVPFSN